MNVSSLLSGSSGSPSVRPVHVPAEGQPRFSSSQVETFLSCGRKWAWDKIAHVPRAEGASASLGSETHNQLETFLAGGALDFTKPSGEIAAKGVHLLPPPKSPGMEIEKEFLFQSTRTGFWWSGRKDIELSSSSLLPWRKATSGRPAVVDHKTTSNLRWAKNPEDLLYDVQANLYAYELATRTGSGEVDLVWIYYPTKSAAPAEPVFLRVSAEHATRMFGLLEAAAARMASHLEVSRGSPAPGASYVLTMAPNPGACSAYGGCPYQHLCKLSPTERMRSLMPQESIMDSLRKRAQQADALAPSSSPAQATRPSINPPEGERKGPLLPPEQYEEPLVKDHDGDEVVSSLPVEKVNVTEAKKTRRGRPPVSKNKAAAPDLLEPKPTDQAPEEPSAATWHLYINAIPSFLREGFIPSILNLETVVERVRPQVQEATRDEKNPDGYPDYRLVPYGAGAGVLVLAVMEYLESAAPLKAVLMDSRTPEGAILQNALSSRAALVVRGT